jgi:calreticulin|mmetsp:Transcript_64184/g.126839  ORF Transcript_64184/g.126839 Transcript_64184/m.126839 type:complete len:393 (-) Transcript_64184:281-1459(-)|eukprot:CAMPEP_0174695008 /NCGR_PEP_ID=MMETSP1094-20130205/1460_1 /TAXON_ID=156173 /ORGANISM="Chrysochromulina brevifilum, Strain UTEX LB 985" /LENGTH=392 /DNA_ID=CAMNT_0015891393 /DNA_START=26 /DNA_END=1204 /DNA_ORIENTATION=+
MQVLSMLAGVLAVASAEVYFEEDFSGDWESKWVQGTMPGKEMGKWVVTPGKWFVDEEVNKGLATSEDMRFYSIGAPLAKTASSKGKPIVLQMSVKIENHQYAYCGGGYIKLLPENTKLETFNGDDEYHIMFGPDLCGYDVSHIHAIFNHKGKNLLKTDKISLEYSDKNEYTHLYTLQVNPDGTYEVFFDLESKSKGTLLENWDFPKPTIDDPADSKPADWVDETEMDDPEAKKPDGYDDIPAQIPDPDATKPEDWDDEDDGEWEPPLIDNPDFKGEWVAPKVANPDYKGEWKPAQIANKDYEEGVQLAAYDSGKLGFELWIVNNGTIFDNILVTDDIEYAKAQGEKLWRPTSKGEKEKKEAWDKENKPADEPADDESEDEPEEEPEEEKDEL